MKHLLTLLFALLLAVPTLGQIRMPPCPTCGKKVNLCPYHGKHPKPKPKPQPAAKPRPQQQGMTEAKKTEIINRLVANMVRVEGGTFQMGATSEQGSEAFGDEKPAHYVTVSAFSIGKYEVTQEEWQAVMGTNPSSFKGAKRPVECVSWDDCQQFIQKLNAKTGKFFRLPTEAEWEYAARGGNRSGHYKYSGTNVVDNAGWYGGNSGDQTHEVGTRQPNELGLYDMTGNVWEWCSDWYSSQYYSSSPSSNPAGPSSGSGRVGRGGGWRDGAQYCRVSYRIHWSPDSRDCILGLRLAL
ncbi:MAG: formylglycine-generating enzyme family protein [Prevotella sp.]|nr:formylglycine-generating enzyme family protein [Prevotella sp.]